MKAIVLAALTSFALASAAAAFPNPNDFSWMRKDFDPKNYAWMKGDTRSNLSVPGFPLTLKNAQFPPGWTLTPRGDGTFTLHPPKSNKGGKSKSGGKRR